MCVVDPSRSIPSTGPAAARRRSAMALAAMAIA
jgi:hypothetical protein